MQPKSESSLSGMYQIGYPLPLSLKLIFRTRTRTTSSKKTWQLFYAAQYCRLMLQVNTLCLALELIFKFDNVATLGFIACFFYVKCTGTNKSQRVSVLAYYYIAHNGTSETKVLAKLAYQQTSVLANQQTSVQDYRLSLFYFFYSCCQPVLHKLEITG